MNGLFSDTLKACSNWFLYIFIAENAGLNAAIMRKRANQIKILKMLDAINTTYTYADLRQIVSDGIEEKYGKTPAEVLTLIYNTATASVNGVGSAISDAATAKVAADLKAISLNTKNTSGTTENKNFWTGLTEVLQYIRELLNIIGVNTDTTKIQPTATEWVTPHNNSTTLSAVGDVLPWVMGGAIIWFLTTNNDSNKSKKKGKSN